MLLQKCKGERLCQAGVLEVWSLPLSQRCKRLLDDNIYPDVV